MAKEKEPFKRKKYSGPLRISPPTVEHLLKRLERKEYQASKSKAGINRHKKMKRSQAEFGSIVAEHYGETYVQTQDSGGAATRNKNRMSQRDLIAITGDIRVSNAKFVFEAKAGYDDVDLDDCFILESDRGGKASKNELKEWFDQAAKEAELTGLMPIIVWRKTNRPILCGFPADYWNDFQEHFTPGCTMLCYDGFVFVRLSEFLQIPKEKLFEKPG
jgi:hypothetical protein